MTGRASNIEHLFSNGKFKFLEGNVTEYIDCPEKLDFVLHFASPASPKDYFENPIHTLKVGALGTLNALGLARSKQAVFLLASTSEVYGDPLESPQRETYWGNVNPVGTRSVYDEAKRFAEAITMSYHREHDVDVRICRIFNCYGPRMRPNDGRALPNFINQSLSGRPLTIYGDGSQTRDFTYVSDVVRAIICAVKSSKIGEMYNVGSGQPVSVNKIVKLLGAEKITYIPKRPGEPDKSIASINKIKKELGWEPKIKIEQGVEELLKNINYWKDAPVWDKESINIATKEWFKFLNKK